MIALSVLDLFSGAVSKVDKPFVSKVLFIVELAMFSL